MPVLLTLLGLGLAALLWATLVERHWYAIRRESIAVLPAGSEPIRVLHIGDLHLARWQKRKIRFLKTLDALQPDLIVNTGDNLGARHSETAALEALSRLSAVPGVFVNGSNDYHEPQIRNPFTYLTRPSTVQHRGPLNTAKLTGGFEGWGWRNLNNSAAKLTVRGTEFEFIGIDDAHDQLDDLGKAKATLNELTANSADSRLVGQRFRIGVSHAPYLRVIREFEASGVEVMFAGHTHGGQVCLPWIGALVTNCDLPRQNAKGLSRWGERQMWLNVVAGIGHSIFAPVRFFCRPEVRLLTLLPRS